MTKAFGGLRGCALLALLVCSCGGAPVERPAASPANQPTGAEGAAGARPDSAPGQAADSAADMSPMSPTAEAPATAEASGRAAARVELARAEAALAAAQGDCAVACRALASMQRATDHLCALVEDSDDGRRCEDARKRLLAARNRVRSSCGECR